MRGLLAPAAFIPLAEETGHIVALGRWVIDAACALLASWAANVRTRQLTLAINISARQIQQADFLHQVLAAIGRHGVDPSRLELELTETLMLGDIEAIIAKMACLKARGVRFSLDDFGTGYSSLAYLARLPLDQLKIDRSFVHDVTANPNNAAIARTVVALAQILGLGVVAEGVETPSQLAYLSEIGCDAYQGYLFGLPLPVAEFEQVVGGATARLAIAA